MDVSKDEELHESLAYKITLIEFGVLFLIVVILLLLFLICILWILYRLLLRIFKVLRRRFGPPPRPSKVLEDSHPSVSKTSFLTSLPPPKVSRLSRCPRCPFHPPITCLPCKHGWRPESKALRVVGPSLAKSTQSLLTTTLEVPEDIVVDRSFSAPANHNFTATCTSE